MQVFLQEDAERCLEEARALKLKATVVLIQKRVSSRTTYKLLFLVILLVVVVYCTPKMHLCTNLTLVRWEDSWLEPGTGRCIELHYAYSTLWKATLQGDNSIRPGILKTGQTVTLISSYLSFFSISFFRFRYQRLRHGVIQLQALFRMWRQRTIYLAVSAFLSNCCRKNCPTCYCGTRPQHTMWAHTHRI